MQISGKLLNVISAVLSAAESRRADAVLREKLRHSGLSAKEKALVTGLVFSFFRWRGWLDLSKPLRAQLEHVNELADAFGTNPGSFSDFELVQRGVPSWTAEVMTLSADLVRAFQAKPVLWLRARPGTAHQLVKILGDGIIHPCMADAMEYQGDCDLFLTPGFHEGQFEVQDLSSQAVGHICGPSPGETWWDACAGEGGKTLHLCDLMGNKGLVWAADPAEWRLAKLRRRAARAKLFNYRLLAWNQTDRLPTRGKFDGVLVDAPCSGTGTWGRNPHARWTVTKDDVHELAGIQRDLLRKVCASVKPGGKLVYSVCTLTVPETAQVADWFTTTQPEFEPITISDPTKPSESGIFLELKPQEVRANGMFIAAWRRSA